MASTATLERLAVAAMSARENNDSFTQTDEDNRHWFIGQANNDNHSHVLIQARKGQDIREANLSTATFTEDLARKAIADIHGALS